MNPWLWILWAIALLIVLFVASAVIAAVWDAIRKPKACERCGHVPGNDVGPWRKPS